MTNLKLGALLIALLSLTACQKKDETPQAPLSDLAKKGKGTYLANCIACHNPDPRIDGSIGPAVAGASLELLEARIMRREYPAGYTPKRKSDQMPDFPQLKDDIPGLHAYLNSFTSK